MNKFFAFSLSTVLPIVVILLLTLTGCEQNLLEKKARQTTLVYCSEGSPDSFDPHTVTFGTAFDASARQIYNRLVEFKPGTVELIPSLAERWTINSTGTQYTFYLRENVAFHSSTEFQPSRFLNADDVIFSFNRQRLADHPFHFVSNRTFAYFDFQGLGNLIEDIRKVDDLTVQFELKRPSSPFLSVLAMEFTSIMSSEYGSQLLKRNQPEKIINSPIGTGPFQLKRYQPDAFIRYQAFDHYWKGKEEIEHLVFAITPDPSLRFARVSAGDCDVMSNPLPIHLGVLDQISSIELISQRGLNISFWVFNTGKPPFDNPLVRRALNHAVNREAIISAVYLDSAEQAVNPIPPDMWSYNEKIKNYAYNPRLARNLLYQAGYPNGFTTDIWAFPEQRAYNPNALKTAELIQQDLKQIGVNARIISYEVGVFLQKVKSGEHQTALQGWIADNGDPDNFFGSLLSCDAVKSGQNSAFWCNEQLDAMIQDARRISDKEKRIQLYRKAQEIIKEQAPWMTIAHTKQQFIVNKRVSNLIVSPAGGVFFSGVKLRQPDNGGKSP